MDIFIIFIILLSVIHFIYEAIIAPTLRLNIRHQLFVLRDRSHEIIVADKLINEDEKAIKLINRYINTAIDRMQYLNLYTIYKIDKKVKGDNKMKEKVKKTKISIENAKDQEIKNIDKELNKLTGKILLVNLGAWLIYLIPVLLIILFVSKLSITIKSFIKNLVQELIFLPNYQFDKFNHKNC